MYYGSRNNLRENGHFALNDPLLRTHYVISDVIGLGLGLGLGLRGGLPLSPRVTRELALSHPTLTRVIVRAARSFHDVSIT